MKKLYLYSIPRSVKQYEEGNKIDEQPCFVNLGAAGKPEDLIQVKHRDTGMVIAPGDDDYDSDEELRPELEDGKFFFLSFCDFNQIWIVHGNNIPTMQFLPEFPEILRQNHKYAIIEWVCLGIPK